MELILAEWFQPRGASRPDSEASAPSNFLPNNPDKGEAVISLRPHGLEPSCGDPRLCPNELEHLPDPDLFRLDAPWVGGLAVLNDVVDNPDGSGVAEANRVGKVARVTSVFTSTKIKSKVPWMRGSSSISART